MGLKQYSFQVVPEDHAKPSMSQACVFSSSVNEAWGALCEVIGADWERERSVAGVGTMGV